MNLGVVPEIGISSTYTTSLDTEQYVDGHAHTNGLESFWSLLKGGMKGTYVSVKPHDVFRHPDEQGFRFNECDGKHKNRFSKMLQGGRTA